ncbi:MAG: glycine cleavage system protein GcvH [Propionibacteriaceae bacterium]|jgi:glycine cleavage system H protein|nr:glycine cleavage system protein GcvH [Propionibacteriaceae bacterium]
MSIPDDLLYTNEHEWVKLSGSTARVGITDFATDSLGEVVFVTLPEVGADVKAGESCGEIESTKSVSDLFAPVTGAVTALNQAVIDAPETVNSDPYGDGWLMEIEVSEDNPDLLESDAYAALTAEA